MNPSFSFSGGPMQSHAYRIPLSGKKQPPVFTRVVW